MMQTLYLPTILLKILQNISHYKYIHIKKLKSICIKLVLKRLSLKLATECTCTFNHKFYEQTDVCAVRILLSVAFSDICFIKMESKIVTLQKPLFCCRYLDDIYNRRKKFKHDQLFQKLTIEVSPKIFLDTSLHLNNGI